MAQSLTLLPGNSRVVYGGLLLGIVGLLAGKYWMRLNRPIADAFAVALPLGMAIQRLGCFSAGCCHGEPSGLFWAVQYPVNTHAHYHHYEQALIGNHDLLSLPVHPSQLYEVAGALLVVTLVWQFGKRWKSVGSSFLFSLSLLALVRFVVEFFRDPLAHANGGMLLGPLNLVQWGTMVVLMVLLPVLIVREKHHRPAKQALPLPEPSPLSLILFFTVSALLVLAFAQWFSRFERIAMLMVFVLASGFMLAHIFRKRQQPVYRWAYSLLLVLPVTLVGLSFSNFQSDSTDVKKTLSVGVGFSSGKFDNNVQTLQNNSDCGPYYEPTYFRQKYSLFGAQVSMKNEYLQKKTSVELGLRMYAGNHSESVLQPAIGAEDSYKVFGLNPHIYVDSKWVGAGAGVHVGDLSYAYNNTKTDSKLTGRELTNFVPMFQFRFGPKRIVFAEYRYADWFPSALPGYRHQYSIGTGFGSDDGFIFRIGSSNYGMLFSSEIPFKNGLTLSPLLHFSESQTSNLQTQFSLGMKYNLRQKVVKRSMVAGYPQN
jgi:phosphatidylglycerol:prolipoprotein diacylglycerol transferase